MFYYLGISLPRLDLLSMEMIRTLLEYQRLQLHQLLNHCNPWSTKNAIISRIILNSYWNEVHLHIFIDYWKLDHQCIFRFVSEEKFQNTTDNRLLKLLRHITCLFFFLFLLKHSKQTIYRISIKFDNNDVNTIRSWYEHLNLRFDTTNIHTHR